MKTFNYGDYWGYTTDMGHYYFESKDGDMLFGDRLPSLDKEGEYEARQILRAANIAHSHAIESFKKKVFAGIQCL